MTSRRPLNILVISNCELNPNQGSGYIITGYSFEMEKKGHSVSAYGPEHFTLFPRFTRLKRLRTFLGYTLMALVKYRLGSSSYDVIELWGSVGWLACLILKIIRKKRCIIVCRSNGIEAHYREMMHQKGIRGNLKLFNLASQILNLLDRVGYLACDLLTLVSKYDEDYAIKRKLKGFNRLLTISNPLPDEWLSQESEEHAMFTVGFVGSWLDRKGVDKLKEIVHASFSESKSFNWLIVGVGQNGKHELLSLGVLSTDQIIESVDRDQLLRLYRQMSVLLCLSTYESFGMVCSEAMSCGVLLLSTDVGLARSLKKGYEYIDISNNTPNDVLHKLQNIRDAWPRSSLIAKAGFDKVQTLSWKHAVDILENRYYKLLEPTVCH